MEYVVTYIDLDGNKKSKHMKAKNRIDASTVFDSIYPSQQIISVKTLQEAKSTSILFNY